MLCWWLWLSEDSMMLPGSSNAAHTQTPPRRRGTTLCVVVSLRACISQQRGNIAHVYVELAAPAAPPPPMLLQILRKRASQEEQNRRRSIRAKGRRVSFAPDEELETRHLFNTVCVGV